MTGAPRSGKTMIAGILKVCGVFTGETDKMLENVSVRDKVMGAHLRMIGADPKGINPLPDRMPLATWDVGHHMEKEGYQDGAWMVKSSRIVPTWKVWQHNYPRARYVIVRRRTGDIISSCMKTAYMDAYKTQKGWKEMVLAYEAMFAQMITELDVKVVWPHRMAHGDYGQVYDMLDWLGLPWKIEVLQWADPKFWKYRNKKR